MMDFRPFEEHTECSLRHLAFDDPRFDLHYDLLVLVPGMKMRRIMIIVIHEDNNAIESADLRHSLPFISTFLIIRTLGVSAGRSVAMTNDYTTFPFPVLHKLSIPHSETKRKTLLA